MTVRVLFLITIFSSSSVLAQVKSAEPVKPPMLITGEFHDLRSTHHTYFRGASLTASRFRGDHFLLGAGIEYTTCSYHNDNGWDLTNLKFVPLFLDLKYCFAKNRFFVPFVQTSHGVSFAQYTKADQMHIFKTHPVREAGYYTFFGVGSLFNLSKHCSGSLAFGFKGFHMSLNDLDVNPHGLMLRAGIGVKL